MLYLQCARDDDTVLTNPDESSCSSRGNPSRERMRWTCELMRDRLRLMEQQIDKLISDIDELEMNDTEK